jgi:hypothetical protein
MKAAKSNFIQQIEHENNRIKDIIKKPRLVETKFETLIGIHEGIESMINEYFESSKIEIKKEVEDILKKWCDKFKNEWKEDLKRLDELNERILKIKNVQQNRNTQQNSKYENDRNGKKKNIKIPSWNEVVDKMMENIKSEVELFDSSIYGEMNEYVDVNLKKEDLERKEVKEMIKMYNELREEVEDGLDEVVEEVERMEKMWMKARSKLEEKGKKWLEVLYVCQLNYLKSVLEKKECDVMVNGEEVRGKLIDKLKGWIY